jgi:4'-phosphopantetheinyl transferase
MMQPIVHPSRLANVAEPLRDDEIHVWMLPYDRAGGRRPLLALLAAYLAIEPSGVMLREGPYGRPALAPSHRSTLDFNWSHSGDHALVALAHGIAPGVDIERQRPRPNALEVARRFFSSDEVALIADAPSARRAQVFLDLWTAKEALLKAHGRGLAFGLDRLSVVAGPASLALRRFDGEDLDHWQLQRLALGHGFAGALAWRGAARQVRLGRLASIA